MSSVRHYNYKISNHITLTILSYTALLCCQNMFCIFVQGRLSYNDVSVQKKKKTLLEMTSQQKLDLRAKHGRGEALSGRDLR